jgi:hypothetical protein
VINGPFPGRLILSVWTVNSVHPTDNQQIGKTENVSPISASGSTAMPLVWLPEAVIRRAFGTEKRQRRYDLASRMLPNLLFWEAARARSWAQVTEIIGGCCLIALARSSLG